MPNHKVRVAVIGGGNMGRNHMRNYFLLPEAELVALADINPATRDLAEQYKATYYEDYKRMLDEMKPEAVSVVVPTPFHAEVATEIMKRGIHLVLEKPITSTVEEANALIVLAKKQNVVFTVGHIEHYNPIIRKIKQMVEDKKIGKITSIVCKRVGGFPEVEPKTDVIIDLAVHDIDIISHLLGGQPKKIHSHGSRTHHSNKIDSAEILMDYGYASGFIQANWLTPVKIRTIALTGSEGYLEGNYITQELVLYKHNMQKLGDSFPNFVIKLGDPKKEIIKVKFEEPLGAELKAFLANVLGYRGVHLVNPSDAREALRLAQEAIKPYRKWS